MVTFTPDGFTIHIPANDNAVEDWLDTQEQLLDALNSIDNDNRYEHNYWRVINLLSEMQPDIETAKKMMSDK